MPRKTTQQEIIAKFQESHGSTYDYTLVEYRNSNTKVKVICSVHGIFEVQPGHHVNGVGCRECYFDSQKTSKAEFVARSQTHFGNRYDYTLFDTHLGAIFRHSLKMLDNHQKPEWHLYDSISQMDSILEIVLGSARARQVE